MDHVNTTKITLFNAYCKECHETVSYWPEFVLSYQREPLETHEQVVVEHLQGISNRMKTEFPDSYRAARIVLDKDIQALTKKLAKEYN